MRNVLVVSILCGAALVAGCGGGSASSGDPKSPSAKASIEVTPMEELKAIPNDLNAQVAEITKPIDEVQSVMDDLANIPKKHGIAAADMASMAKATFDSGKVSVSLKGDVSAEAKAEVEAALKRLADVVVALKATPDKVAALTKNVAAATAKVPVLATKVTTSATATVSNPFGNAADKAKAQAELDGVKQVQADVSKSIGDVQQKLSGIPGMATQALAKLSASFAAGT